MWPRTSARSPSVHIPGPTDYRGACISRRVDSLGRRPGPRLMDTRRLTGGRRLPLLAAALVWIAALAARLPAQGSSSGALAIVGVTVIDIVILDANPLDDIRNTRRIHAVIQNGRAITRAELDALLADVRAASAAPVPGRASPPPHP